MPGSNRLTSAQVEATIGDGRLSRNCLCIKGATNQSQKQLVCPMTRLWIDIDLKDEGSQTVRRSEMVLIEVNEVLFK